MVHRSQDWPELGEERDGATIAALHLFSQVAGKVPTALLPWRNHGWHLTFHICPEGFRPEPIPAHAGTFELGFDLISHRLTIEDRKSVGWGKSVSVSVDLGGSGIINKKKKNT